MRTYNERIADVALSDTGMPTGWTWRNRRYAGVRAVDFWISTNDWWLEEEASTGLTHIHHWLIDAQSDHGAGQLELAYDEVRNNWRLVGIVD